MVSQAFSPERDPVLLPYFEAEGEDAQMSARDQLVIEVGHPAIKRALNKRGIDVSIEGLSRNPDAADLFSKARLHLLNHLPLLRKNRHKKVIYNFSSYVERIAENVCNAELRMKHPQRESVKGRIYEALKSPPFALWSTKADGLLCGLSEAKGQPPTAHLEQLAARLSNLNAASMNIPDLLAAVFREADRPLRFSHAVTVVASLIGVRDRQPESLDVTPDVWQQRLIDPRIRGDKLTEQRSSLRVFWRAVLELPPLHRKVYLLGYRTSPDESALHVLLKARAVEVDEAAAQLELTVDDLYKLLPELPLEYADIARRLKLPRRQTAINRCHHAHELVVRFMQGYK